MPWWENKLIIEDNIIYTIRVLEHKPRPILPDHNFESKDFFISEFSTVGLLWVHARLFVTDNDVRVHIKASLKRIMYCLID